MDELISVEPTLDIIADYRAEDAERLRRLHRRLGLLAALDSVAKLEMGSALLEAARLETAARRRDRSVLVGLDELLARG